MYPISIIGVLVLVVVIERFFAYRNMAIDKEDFNEKLFGMILRGDIRQAVTFCDSRPAPLSNTLKAGLVQVVNRRPDEEVQVAMDGAALNEAPRIEGYTPFLAVFGNVATLLGLLGTIAGMIKSFRAVAEADAATKSAELSKGIAEAMNCTAFGLITAIPSLFAFAFLQGRTQHMIDGINEAVVTEMNLVLSNRHIFVRTEKEGQSIQA
jgi:biopolymer transport protein ExbB/TolQ